MTRMPRQQEMLPDDEPMIPPALRDELDEFLGQEENHRAEAARIKDLRDTLVANMVAGGIARIPYTNAADGKRKYFVADTTARAKKISAAGSDGKAKRARENDVEVNEAVAVDTTIEKRRVKRTKQHDQMADPFAGTRESLTDEADRKQTEH